MPAMDTLVDADAGILAEVLLLGHYPRSLDAKGLDTAPQGRKDERNLRRRLDTRKKSMDPQLKKFIDAVKDAGGVSEAMEAVSSVLGSHSTVHTLPALPHAGQSSSSGQASELAVPVVSQGSQCAISTFPAHVIVAVYCFYWLRFQDDG